MKRPHGITVLACLLFLNVAFYAALLLLALFNPDALAIVLKALSPGSAGPEIQLRLGRLLPLYYSLATVGIGLVGVGFWKLWNWARIVILALTALSAIALFAAEAPTAFRSGSLAAIALWIVRLALSALLLWYLSTAKVRAAFRKTPRPASAAVSA